MKRGLGGGGDGGDGKRAKAAPDAAASAAAAQPSADEVKRQRLEKMRAWKAQKQQQQQQGAVGEGAGGAADSKAPPPSAQPAAPTIGAIKLAPTRAVGGTLGTVAKASAAVATALPATFGAAAQAGGEAEDKPRIRMWSFDDDADDDAPPPPNGAHKPARRRGPREAGAGGDEGDDEDDGDEIGPDPGASAEPEVDPLDAFMTTIGGEPAQPRPGTAPQPAAAQSISFEQLFGGAGPAGHGTNLGQRAARGGFDDVLTDTPMTDQSGDEGGGGGGGATAARRVSRPSNALARAAMAAASHSGGAPDGGAPTGAAGAPAVDDEEDFHRAFVEAMRRANGEDGGAAAAAPAAPSAAAPPPPQDERFFDDDNGEGADIFGLGSEGETAEGARAEDGDEGGGGRGEGLYGARRRKELAPVDHSTIEYPPFRKSFFVEAAEQRAMSAEQVAARRQALDMRVHGKRCPKPISRWTQCGLPDAMLSALERHGYAAPFAVQAQALPALMAGRDVIGIAKTGSGKTIAYALPMLRHALDQPALRSGDGPIALVIVPTRELAVQVFKEANRFAKAVGATIACIYGGTATKQQIDALKRGAEAVVCTPGRMIDMLTTNSGRVTNLRRVTFVVLDEADRMFDLGFEPQVKRLLANVRPDRQVALFSATFPKAVDEIARQTLHKPVQVIVGGVSVVSSTITQHVDVVPSDAKFDKLCAILNRHLSHGQALVFVDTHDAADKLFGQLVGARYPTLSLHGRMDQCDRDSVVADFKCGAAPVLVATSVAARGLDVKDLVCVVNYDVPSHYEDYVHRVGRTGRAGRKGDAYTLLCPEEEKHAPDLVRALELAKQEVPDDLAVIAATYTDKKQAGLLSAAAAKKKGFRHSGHKGFGFDQSSLDAQAEKDRKARRMKLRAEGVELEASESEDEDGAGAQAARRNPKLPAPPPPPTAGGGAQPAPTPMPMPTPTDALAAAASSAAQAIAARLGLDPQAAARQAAANAAAAAAAAGTQPAAAAANLPVAPPAPPGMAGGAAADPILSAQERARAAAAEVASRIGLGAPSAGSSAAKLPASLPQAPPPPPGVMPPPGAGARMPRKWLSTEIEINDYPKTARWKVTHKEALISITEWTRAAITTKGVYTPPGKNPPPGERKLYLLIEAEDPAQIKEAKQEIKRILEETSAYAAPDEKVGGGRYSVV